MTNLKITTPSGTFEIPDSGYLSSPGTVCPKTPLHIREMTETDISKVLIEGDTATINGVKYKRVEPPKSRTLFIEILNKTGGRYDPRITKEFIDIMKEWLPDELEYDGEEYHLGWNDALRTIKDKLR
jgi:hypothetical protein